MKGYVRKETHEKLRRQLKVAEVECATHLRNAEDRMRLLEVQQDGINYLKSKVAQVEREHGREIELREDADQKVWKMELEIAVLKETVIEMAKELHFPETDDE